MDGDYLSFGKILVSIPSFVILCIITLDLMHVFMQQTYPFRSSCTLGILQVFHVLAIMQLIRLGIPRTSEVTLFLTEGYESVSFIFFVKLILAYIGGTNTSKILMKGQSMQTHILSICYLIFLPTVKFTKKFLFFCEVLTGLYSFFWTIVGVIWLLMTVKGDKSYPESAISGNSTSYYRMILIILLFLAIYGLSGIYHSAEDKLNHRGIIKKFLVYKILTLAIKLSDILRLVHADGLGLELFEPNLPYFPGLRIRSMYGLLVVVQALIAFPVAILLNRVFCEVHQAEEKLPDVKKV